MKKFCILSKRPAGASVPGKKAEAGEKRRRKPFARPRHANASPQSTKNL